MARLSLYDPAACREIVERLESASPDAARQWGTMSFDRAICHLADHLRFAVGELRPEGPRGPLTWRPLQWLAIAMIPWPHARLTASPELLQTAPSPEFDGDRRELLRLIEEFVSTDRDKLGPHPMFGHLSPDLWGILAYRHCDHHLRQFSC